MDYIRKQAIEEETATRIESVGDRTRKNDILSQMITNSVIMLHSIKFQ